MTEPPLRKQPLVRRVTRLDPYKPYILQRWNDGCRSARQLWRELVDQGYTYGESSVQRYVHHLRLETGTRQKFRRAQPAQHYLVTPERPQPLTALQLARVCMTDAGQRQAWHTRYLTYLCKKDETITRTCQQVEAFVTMVRQRQGDHFDAWLAEVQATGVPEVRAFARGLQKDYAAVKAGLTLAYSNGQTEAQIHRLKLLKRAMYGQAGFELLRKRVLHRDPPLPVKRRGSKAVLRLAA
ncbi:MAG: hypothetical protein CYG59_26415 [Chloroflexi bacterium]|nr:MAG: hypothetical protein CYG59_26415 [Chloroflexota bacterium]